jgi:hypothetical protein
VYVQTVFADATYVDVALSADRKIEYANLGCN